MADATLRIDKLLWFLRLAKSRSIAQDLIGEGHLRLNSRRVERCAQGVAVGDVLVIPLGNGLRIVEIIALPDRRGPALEAQGCYRVLDERRPVPLAASTTEAGSSMIASTTPAPKGVLQP